MYVKSVFYHSVIHIASPSQVNPLLHRGDRFLRPGWGSNKRRVIIEVSGETGSDLVRKLTELTIINGDVPSDWHSSCIVNLYISKGAALDRGNYCGQSYRPSDETC